MFSKLIGGIMLIVGTCIGAGILALPMVTAPGGLIPSSLLLILCWVFMTFSAFILLEVNLWLPEGSNIISMAKTLLGPWSAAVAWVTYLLLLVSILCAYLSGTGDIVSHWLGISQDLATFLVLFVLGSIIYAGIRIVDYANRNLLSVKLLLLIFLIVLIIKKINFSTLPPFQYHPLALVPAVMIAFLSFAYSVLIPSLRYYFKSDIKQLRRAVFWGSLIPLILYLLWDFAVQSFVTFPPGSSTKVSALVDLLSVKLGHPFLGGVVTAFTTICMFTSFLGVGLCLVDFLADGLKLEKKGFSKVVVHALAFLPPLLIVFFNPNIFIKALDYAGVFVIVLMMLMPSLMAWQGRYRTPYAASYRVIGGKPMLLLTIMLSLGLIIFSFFHI